MNSDFPSERAARNHRWLTVASALLFYAGAYAMARFAYGPVMGFVICTPILSGYLAWLLIHRAESWLFLPKWMALRKIHGKRHFFDDRPVRIEESEGRCLIAAEDIFGILGQRPSAQTLRRLQAHLGEQGLFQGQGGEWWFEEAAVLQWLRGRAERLDRRTLRLHRWLEQEALPAFHRKMEIRVAGGRSNQPDIVDT